MQSEDRAVAAIVVGIGVDAAAVVGLAVETGTAAAVVVPISGHTESIDTHFPDPSSIVPAGHSHLRLSNHDILRNLQQKTLVGIRLCKRACYILDQGNSNRHCTNDHIHSIAYHLDTNYHIKELLKIFSEFIIKFFMSIIY